MKKVIPFLAILLTTACAPFQVNPRQEPPADPNQALLQMMQQQTLNKAMKIWEEFDETKYAKPDKKCKENKSCRQIKREYDTKCIGTDGNIADILFPDIG